MKILITALLAVFCLIKDCKEKPMPIQEQDASVKVFVCSRGCYKYLIEIKGTLFYPDSLPDKFKKDKMQISVTGTMSAEKVTVYKPGANDVPIPNFEVKVFKIKTVLPRQ